jgi:hypothetical protein
MDRDALLVALRRPRSFALSIETWRAAAVLGGLRVAVNDPIRSGDRDRGQQKNWLADIWGTIGELVALRRLNLIEGLPVKHHPIAFHGPVNDVDLVASTSDGPLRLEAKAHLVEPGKEWFMVNKRAHARSTRRGAVAYIPVLGVLGSSKALAGHPILRSDMDSWGPPDKPLKDPAIGITLDTLASRYFAQSLPQAAAVVNAETLISRSELEKTAKHAGEDLNRWRQSLPPLEDLPAAQVVTTINKLL